MQNRLREPGAVDRLLEGRAVRGLRSRRTRSSSCRSWARRRAPSAASSCAGSPTITAATVWVVVPALRHAVRDVLLPEGRARRTQQGALLPPALGRGRAAHARPLRLRHAGDGEGDVPHRHRAGRARRAGLLGGGHPLRRVLGDGDGRALDRPGRGLRDRVGAGGDLPLRRRAHRGGDRARDLVRCRGGHAGQPHAPLARGTRQRACRT